MCYHVKFVKLSNSKLAGNGSETPIQLSTASVISDNLLVISTKSVLTSGPLYEVTVSNYVSKITGAKNMGIFAGLAYAQPTNKVFTYTSQFQVIVTLPINP